MLRFYISDPSEPLFSPHTQSSYTVTLETGGCTDDFWNDTSSSIGPRNSCFLHSPPMNCPLGLPRHYAQMNASGFIWHVCSGLTHSLRFYISSLVICHYSTSLLFHLVRTTPFPFKFLFFLKCQHHLPPLATCRILLEYSHSKSLISPIYSCCLDPTPSGPSAADSPSPCCCSRLVKTIPIISW